MQTGNRGNKQEYGKSPGNGEIGKSSELDKELKEIFERTYGTAERKKNRNAKTVRAAEKEKTEKNRVKEDSGRQEYLLVDGYNIIFSWEELRDLAAYDLGAARSKLMDILSNYQGYKNNTLILVLDAYKVEGNTGQTMKYHNIYVVYTKEAETADQYIEKAVHRIDHRYNLTVATSDALEQIIIMGQGAIRMSAKEFKEEVQDANIEIAGTYLNRQPHSKDYLFDHLPKDLMDSMEEIRLGKKKNK
jgi:predicted RNA-binding protein with PIN domain